VVLAGWVVALALLAAVVYAGTATPHLRHDSALDTVFDARWLIAGARLLALVAVLYLLASIAVRVQHGQWVRSAGSVVTDATTAEAIAADREDLQRQLVAAKSTIDDLTGRLDRSLATREASLAGSMETSPEVRSPDPGEGSEGSDDRT
jgi:type VI protein secretion system component VasK